MGSRAPVDLAGGLRLRRADAGDLEDMVALFRRIWRESFGVWMRSLLNGGHPNVGVEDFTIIEDTTTGAIVSMCGLLRQRWEYNGVAFAVATPEGIVTDERYRRRGLVRRQLAWHHRDSEGRGDLMQSIFGIPPVLPSVRLRVRHQLRRRDGCRPVRTPRTHVVRGCALAAARCDAGGPRCDRPLL